MATLAELAGFKHHAIRSDGAKFIDGERDDTLYTSWLSVNGGLVTLRKGLYDELLVVKGEVTDDQIKTWAAMQSPFFDPSPVIQENQIPAADNWNKKVMTFYQSTPPTATAVGDLWVDLGDSNRLYRWSGTTWVDINDMTPIDASQRPVSVEGAGGRIEMDKHGQRFIRASDGKTMIDFNTESGSANFAGDISGASGTFTGPVKSVDDEGNYSLLDQARLRFYRRIGDEDVLSYYVAQIATGEAVDGQVVDLGALGYRFFERPKIVLQPKLNRVFVANTTNRDVWMDWDVTDETFNPETGEASFRVRARTIIKGGTVFSSFSPNKLQSTGTLISPTTGLGTTYVRLRLSGYAFKWALSNAKISFDISYRKVEASSWILLDSKTYTGARHAEFSTNLSYNLPDSGQDGYQIRISLTHLDNSTQDPDGIKKEHPHLTVYEFEYRSGETVLSDPNNPEIVSWIAIDGG